MKIRRNLRRENLELLVEFLEKVLNDDEISTLSGLLVGGVIARCFKNSWNKINIKKLKSKPRVGTQRAQPSKSSRFPALGDKVI